ncbi:hypothetical protein BaRGS_00035465 [Batillaria attramentaria]|uniref:PLAT domain-containing protein n=1 Tax=Batillaria attramentaria TaxID=370345 RepID=A0ABD0JEL2_9CAEN
MYTYRWSLSIADFRWVNTGGWRPLREIDITVNNKVTGLNTPELAIAPELLSDYDSEYKTSRFKAECTLKDNGTAAGKAAVYLTLNTPPHGGNCSIEPKEMHATTEKLFAIECADWEDDTGIAKFEFFSTNGDGSDHQLTWVVSQKSRVSLKVSVPQGLKHLDYTSSVYVVVRDVTPAPAKDACSLIKKLPVDQNSTLAKKSAEGDLIHFTEFANSVTSIVNSDRLEGACLSGSNATDAMRDEGLEETTSTTPQTTTETAYLEYRGELQRDNRAKLREKLLELMLNLPLNDVLSMDQIAAAMRDTLKFPDEVTNEAQNLVMEMMLRMSERLADDESVTREERMKNLKFMIGAQGSSLAAGGTSGFTATLTMLDRAKNTEYFDDYDEESDDCVDLHPKGIDEAVQAQKARANCILTRRNSTQMVQKATTVKERILASFQNNSVQLETDEFTTEYQQTTLSKTNSTTIRGKRLKLQNSSASAEFSEDIADFLSDASIGDNDSLVLELTQNEDVPLRYSEGAKKLAKTSAIVTVGVLKTPADGSKSTYISMKPKARRSRVTRDAKKTDVQFVVVFSQGYMPDHHVGHCDAAFLVPANLTDTERALCRTVMLGNTKIGTAFVGVRQLLPNETNMDVSDCKLPRYWTNSTEFLHSNVTEAGEVTSAHVTSAHVTSAAGLIFSKSTEAAGVTPAIDFSSVTVSPDPSVTSNYSINMFTTACYGRSEVDEDWNSEGLTVRWSVAPNRIDWNYVFGNLDFDKNPTIYVTQIVIVLLYILAVVKARRKDKRDIELLGFAPLMDNDPNDKYFYEIEVVTGMRSNAGTKSKVYFVLSGEEEESEVREFADNKRPIFQRGSTNGFLMATPRPLGEIHYARIWHDNSGKGKFGGWYLSHVTVRDVQTGEKWMFIANKWFSVEEDDGKVDRILYSSSREQMTEFSHRFKQTSKRNMTDEHLWFSVLARPPQSRFTCVQRVSCCVCLLYLSMLASAMFYKGEDSSSAATAESLHYGPFVMSYEQLYKGVMCNLIVFPASFFIITLFRKARPRHKANVTPTGTFDNSQVSVRFDNAKMDRKSVNDVECGSGASSSMTSVPENSLATKKKKKLSLPWWCRLVAWFLLIACTVVSAFFVTAYGIMFGDDKSRKWITSLLVSFVMSVFITQPVKVFLFAIIVSLFLKEPSDADDTEEKDDEDVTKSTMLGKDELPLHEMNTDKTAAAHRDKAQCKPPSKTELKKARRRRMQEVEMWAAVREVVIYAIYISLLLLISYRTCTANTFLYKDTMERVFIKSTDTAISFDQIRNVEDFWAWAKSGLVNGLRAGPYYNNFPPFMLRGFVNDKVSKIVGYATMRQLRTGQDQCVMDRRVMATIRECNAGYEIKKQEEGEFDISWKPRTANSTVNDTAEWYRYSPADELNGYPHLGRLAVYSGGGYVVRLLGSRPDLADLMNRLEKEKWIDRYTRAVIVEFTTYNAQVNLFGIATIIAEFAPSGGVVQEYHFEPALLLPYVTTSFYIQVACEILYCLIIVFFIVRLLMVLVKEKAEFFYCFWNLVDLSIISLSISAIVIYFYRLYETKRLVQKFKDTQGVDYINFQYVRYWNELFGYMVGWTVFLATLKFLPLIRFNEKMSLLGATLKKSSRSLIQFSVDIKYSSFISSVVSGVLMMMGKFEIYKLVMAEPVLALIFFFLFVTCVTFIIVNMFVSILNDTFSAVRRDKALKNDLAIISFMFDRIKRMAGRGDNTSAATATVTPLDETPGEHVEDVQDPAVTAFPDRVDCLLRSLARYYGSRDDGDYQQQLAVLGRSAASRQGHSTPRL